MEIPPDPNAPCILVVDDDAAMRALIEAYLAKAGYRTQTAADGREALRRLAAELPTAMILDLHMPRMDGFGLLREMKKLGLLQRTPTLVLTASGQAGVVMEAVQLGARDYLAKPFEEAMLLSRISRLLRPSMPGRQG